MMHRRRILAALALGLIARAGSSALAAEKLTVFAAASLKNALDAVSAGWKADTGGDIVISYAASSALARQIEQGAPADVFFSADLDWMEYLAGKSLVPAGGAVQILSNEIVLIAPKDATATVAIENNFALKELLGGGKLAIADVKAVPAGKYGKAALETLGVWASVEDSLAQAENVRAALKLVAAGEAPLGIVYKTDAAAEPAVKVIAAFPASSHPPIIYPASVTSVSTNGDAAKFVTYLQSAKAEAIFTQQGFTVLAPPATN
jgi:molybdate transport system substrate-binding protein